MAKITVDDGRGGTAFDEKAVTVNTPPVIDTFVPTPDVTDTLTEVTFSWSVSDADGDILSCQLDVNGDGSLIVPVSDCANNTSYAHTYSVPGIYDAKLVVDDGKTSTPDERFATVMITTMPEITDFSASPNPTETGTPVTFTWVVSDADGDTLTCLLDLDGDGADDQEVPDCANTTSLDHTYSTGGDYPVRLTVDDGSGGVAESTITVSVNEPPVISGFSITPSPAFINSTATFSWLVSDGNGDTLSCLLDVDNDGTDDYTINDCANVTTQDHTFTAAGDYTAKLTVSDGIAAPVETTISFTVISPLAVDVSLDMTPAVADERLLYTITVSNTTALPIDGVSVLLNVPVGLSFNDTQDVQPDPAGCNAGSSVTCEPAEEASWDLGTLAASEVRAITINALVDPTLLSGDLIVAPVRVSATNMLDVIDLLEVIAVQN